MPEVKLNLPTPPEGYEYTGEFRCLEEGELCLDGYGHWYPWRSRIPRPHPVIAKKRWRADLGEEYFLIASQVFVVSSYDNGTSADDRLYKAGNYFQTEAEAKIMAQKVKQLFEENL